MNLGDEHATFKTTIEQTTRKHPMKQTTLKEKMRPLTSRIQSGAAACSVGRAGMLLLLVCVTATASAQSGIYQPLTLAQAQQDAAGTTGSAAPAQAGQVKTADAPGEAHHGKSADEVARELANPAGSLASLTFKNQFRIYDGDLPDADDQWNYTLLFQPVFPFPLGETSSGGKANFYARPAFPIVFDQPVPTVRNGNFGYDKVTGLGDIGFDLMYGVTEKSGIVWAFGMVGTLPTASDNRIAGKQLRLGPEALFLKIEKWGMYGVFPSQQWNVTGWSDQSYANTQIQPVFRVLPGGGWSISTQPIMNYDWNADQWNIPLNLTVSKTVHAGKTPLKVEVEFNYYVERPDVFASKFMVGLNLTPVVPNFINNLFH